MKIFGWKTRLCSSKYHLAFYTYFNMNVERNYRDARITEIYEGISISQLSDKQRGYKTDILILRKLWVPKILPSLSISIHMPKTEGVLWMMTNHLSRLLKLGNLC